MSDHKKVAKRYFHKYFRNQYFTESDLEFKALVRILNKVAKTERMTR